MGDYLPLSLHDPEFLYEHTMLYLHMVANPFRGGLISAMPATGIIALVLAVVIALRKREAALWWLLLPIAVSHLLVAFSAYMIGVETALVPSVIVFGIAEIGLILVMLYRCRKSQLAGVLGGWFALSYFCIAAMDSLLFFAAG